jgi:patatin-like phospholipase/acyl hydrolase
MYKILSLDGGGMHGYAIVTIVKRLLKEYPNLIKDVDLIAGTSIGGIVGLGLALGHDIESVEDNFIKGVPLAFNTNAMRKATFITGISTKYDNRKFRAFLRAVYGPTKLKDANKKVLIPAFCLDNEDAVNRRWKAKIFHNFEGVDSDGETKAVDVAMATSSAPVFFPAYNKYIDGALVANNPAFCAIAQTQDMRCEISNRPSLEKISVLSIGTIRNVYIENRNMEWGYFMWSRSLLNMLTERDTMMVNYLSDVFLRERYHRIEPVINGPMDNFEEMKTIRDIGKAYPLEKTFDWLNQYWS